MSRVSSRYRKIPLVVEGDRCCGRLDRHLTWQLRIASSSRCTGPNRSCSWPQMCHNVVTQACWEVAATTWTYLRPVLAQTRPATMCSTSMTCMVPMCRRCSRTMVLAKANCSCLACRLRCSIHVVSRKTTPGLGLMARSSMTRLVLVALLRYVATATMSLRWWSLAGWVLVERSQ